MSSINGIVIKSNNINIREKKIQFNVTGLLHCKTTFFGELKITS